MLAQFFPPHSEEALWLATIRLDLPNQSLWAMYDEVGTAGLTEKIYLQTCEQKRGVLLQRVEEVRSCLGVRHKHPLFLTLQQLSIQILQELEEAGDTIATILYQSPHGRVEIMHRLRQSMYTICFLVEEWRLLLQKALGSALQRFCN